MLTPREAARLQYFPDSFKLDESDKVSYKQLGNSVNVFNSGINVWLFEDFQIVSIDLILFSL